MTCKQSDSINLFWNFRNSKVNIKFHVHWLHLSSIFCFKHCWIEISVKINEWLCSHCDAFIFVKSKIYYMMKLSFSDTCRLSWANFSNSIDWNCDCLIIHLFRNILIYYLFNHWMEFFGRDLIVHWFCNQSQDFWNELLMRIYMLDGNCVKRENK